MLVVVIEESIDLRAREVLAEFLLGKEPRRIDVVIVRRRAATVVEAPPLRIASVLDAMPAHAVVLFKGATDALEAFDATQALSYVAEYMLVAGIEEPADVALRVLSPRFLTERGARPVDERERALYNRLYRCVEQLATTPEGAMAKDVDLVLKNWEKDLAEIIPRMNPAVVLEHLTPEQRLMGLAPEEALRAVPMEVLRGLSEDYVRTLSPELQAFVRARRGA